MWVVAGVLLGLVVLGALAGLHFGPHAHLVTAVLGVLAAAWLVAMLALGQTRPILYVLLGADLALSLGVGAAARRALRDRNRAIPSRRRLEAAPGVALSALAPEGIVRVRGETWSARSANGNVAAGEAVQVIGVDGLRLEVWGEGRPPDSGGGGNADSAVLDTDRRAGASRHKGGSR